MGLDNFKFAKPGRGKWRVVPKGEDVFEVRDAEGEVYGTYLTIHAAEAARGHGQRRDDAKVSRKVRPCMTCRKPFESEGIHNRMCNGCRAQNGEWDPYALAPRSGRAK
jgi:hypothetical protein